jgi:hypothetical protein
MISLLFIIAAGGICYIICFYFLAKKELFELKNFLLKKYE